MEGGDQRCSLTAECHIFGAEITDHINAGFDGQTGTVAYLQREAQSGSMADGLAMGPMARIWFG